MAIENCFTKNRYITLQKQNMDCVEKVSTMIFQLPYAYKSSEFMSIAVIWFL